MEIGRVKITGLGLTTPLGATRWATFAALSEGKCTLARMRRPARPDGWDKSGGNP
jgi:hypothetical protein